MKPRFAPLLGAFLAVGLQGAPLAGQDTGWTITSFEMAFGANPDRTIDVTEVIDVDFGPLEKHGIYRDIPVAYAKTVDAGIPVPAGRVKVDLGDVRVTDGEGRPLMATVSRGQRVRVRIGDPDRTVSGEQTYVIHYRLERGLGFFEDHDELYWQVTGTEWPVPILAARATVSIPDGDSRAPGWGAWCYAGWYESSDASRCTAEVVGDGTFRYASGRLDPGEGLTLVASFPKGIIAAPTALEETARVVGLWWPASLPLIALALMTWLWSRRGRELSKRSVVPDWRVPEDLRPGAAGTLWDQVADMDDVVATILDLGVRGFLRIREVPPAGILGAANEDSFAARLLGTLGLAKTDWELERTGPAGEEGLGAAEKLVLEGVFESGRTRRMSELNNAFYKHLPAIHRALYEESVAQGLFARSPSVVRRRIVLLGVGVCMAGVLLGMLAENLLLVVALLLSGLVVLAFAPAMPARTARGARKWEQLRGLEEYVRRAEKEELELRHAPERTTELFEAVLPYAVALDVSDLWVEQFEPVLASHPPTWYVGSQVGAFSAGSFADSLGGFRTAATRTLGSSPGSSSGSGGGGSVGGGGGGGGGGSW